jgi:adenine-specific DNA methylase
MFNSGGINEMKKYIGNKSKIVPIIYNEISALVPTGTATIFDAFSGTTNVGQFFKKNGYTVLANDINTTSRVLGKVYIELNSLPTFNNLLDSSSSVSSNILAHIGADEFISKKKELYSQNRNTCDVNYMQTIYDTNAYNVLTYLTYFSSSIDYNDSTLPYQLPIDNFIRRNYCASGKNSQYFNLVSQKSIIAQMKTLEKYSSSRNNLQNIIKLLASTYEPPYPIINLSLAIDELEKYIIENPESPAPISKALSKLKSLNKRKNHIGKRMFFSETHGERIDTILSTIIYWYRNKLINEGEYNFLLCALLEAVALFSNTSATYQAFYKTYRNNTLQPFRLVIPEIIESDKTHRVFCEDTFELIQNIDYDYDVLYLDPPYNWRIYDSNYHLLNLIADFDNIIDEYKEYESGISGAAGENRNLVRNYTNYNKRETFEDLLFELIKKSRSRLVAISYSDSNSNHNKNSLSCVNKIENFLNSIYFVPGSFKKVEIRSKNFESRKTKHKKDIHELLFLAEKRMEE